MLKVGPERPREPSSKDMKSVSIQEQGSGQKYFTLLARNLSACGPFKIVLSSCTVGFTGPVSSREGTSRRPQTHGNNRNRIVLHVMLNGRINRARSS